MRKVLVCYVTSNIKEIELPDEMVETFMKPMDNDPDFCLYDECRKRLDEETNELLYAEDAETGHVLCEW